MDNENNLENADSVAPATDNPPPSNLPLIITLVALVIYFGFQSLALVSERSNLSQVKANQDAGLQEAQKVQSQFRLIVGKTGELADKGHAGAKMVMEGLQRQGMGAGMMGPVKSAGKAPEKLPEKAEAKAAK